jgi:glutamine amidotransferase
MKIGVLNYGAGNLRSVANALTHLGADFFISDNPKELETSDKLIFPGVGHAKSAMNALRLSGMDDMLKNYAAGGRGLLGICLGSQLLLESSEEGDTACLAFISGECRRFPKGSFKVPQIGWNNVFHCGHPLFNGIPSGSAFYFVHSYYTLPNEESNILCETDYILSYASGLVKDNIVSVQFHPERSGKWGLRLLSNFLELL